MGDRAALAQTIITVFVLNQEELLRDSKVTCKLSAHPLVELEPSGEALAVLIVEAKEPGFSQPDRLHYLKTSENINKRSLFFASTHRFDWKKASYLVKQLFTGCAGQNGKLQLCIHGCNSDIYLPERKKKKAKEKLSAVHTSEKQQETCSNIHSWVKKITTKSMITLFVL